MPSKPLTSILTSWTPVIQFLLLTCILASADTYYLDPTGGGDGSTWDEACWSFQELVEMDWPLMDGDVVLCSNGVYDVGGIVANGATVTNRFCLDKAITVRSVNGPEVTFIKGASSGGGLGAAAIRCAYLTNGAQLIGFTLTNGYTAALGAGVVNQCGGGAYLHGGGTISSCIVISCEADGGGGIGVDGGHGTITSCSILTNTAVSAGGGVIVRTSSSASIDDCTLADNIADLGGGVDNNGSTYFQNCTIANNESTGGGSMGGGMANSLGSLLVVNSTISGNRAANVGGGFYNGSYIYLLNTIVINNTATSSGDDIHCAWGMGCYGYYSWYNGVDGTVSVQANAPNVTNAYTGGDLSAIADNGGFTKTMELTETAPAAGTGAFAYTNSTVGAYFVDDVATAHTLTNWGVNPTVTAGDKITVDQRGETREEPVSMGAYQIQAAPALDVVYVDASVGSSGVGTNWATAFKTIQEGVDAVSTTGTVWVTNGVYDAGGAVTPGYALTNRLVITNAITVHSVNGPDITAIVGAPGSNGSNDYDAIRGVYMENSSSLIGFTITNGYTSPGNMTNMSGGGLFMEADCYASNCVITGNSATYSGGGAYISTNCILESCTLSGNWSEVQGAGAFLNHGGMLNQCIIADNSAKTYGGGVRIDYNGSLVNCEIRNNVNRDSGTGSGAGVFLNSGGRLICSIVEGNTGGYYGGGVNCYQGGFLDNSLVIGNDCTVGGGVIINSDGMLNNCTISSNSAVIGGGLCLLNGGTARNSIIWDNSAPTDKDIVSSGAESNAIRNCCSSETVTNGVYGCITNNPLFMDSHTGNYRLEPTSPCINSGDNMYAPTNVSPNDLAGNARIMFETVDMGAYETQVMLSTNLGPAGGGNTIVITNGALGASGDITNVVVCGSVAAIMDQGDNWVEITLGASTDIYQSVTGDVIIQSTSLGDTTFANAYTYNQGVYYADAAQADDSGNGLTWATAKRTIQAAVDLAEDGCLVWVTNGVYNENGAVTPGTAMTNRVCITSAITLQSVNGPDVTIIAGAPDTVGGSASNGPAAIRGVFMTNGCSLIGFSVTNAYTMGIDGDFTNPSLKWNGGGVWMATNCVGSNLIVRGCSANAAGGGVYFHFGGTLDNSVLIDNSASEGGGAGLMYGGTISSCTLSNNTVPNSGGGAYLWGNALDGFGTMNNCTVNSNAARYGGGVKLRTNCVANNCTISGNASTEWGGGVHLSYGGTLNNCLVTGNSGGDWGGGVELDYYGTMNNCTISGNTAANAGGAEVYLGGSLNNCIVFNNTSSNGPDLNLDNPGPVVRYTCASDGVTDGVDGCTTNNPLFKNEASGNYRLSVASPCINTGDNAYAPTNASPYDLAGIPRILAGTVDMGAYETDIAYADAAKADDSGDGRSWATAKKTIQGAVDMVQDEGTVFVTNGIYNTGSMITPDLELTNRVCITNAITVQSMNGPALTIIEGQTGSNGSNDADSVRGVYMTNSCILSGFTVRDGCTLETGGDPTQEGCGGGIWLSIDCTVTNCIIYNNAAVLGGGGIYAYDGGLIDGCTVYSNFSFTGGGVFLDSYVSQGGTLIRSFITDNEGFLSGGGVYLCENCRVDDCVIVSNSVLDSGGGLFLDQGGVVTNCLIAHNEADYGGGALIDDYQFAEIEHCTIRDNYAYEAGGGIYLADNGMVNNCQIYSNLTEYGGGGAVLDWGGSLNSCLIYANSSTTNGGGGTVIYDAGDINNCTIYGNNTPQGDGGGSALIDGGSMNNCIIWGNTAPASTNKNIYREGSGSYYYTCSPDGIVHGAFGCITNDPQLVNDPHDLRLRSSSPCFNAGDNSYVYPAITPTDMAGEPRISFTTVDIGAYELSYQVSTANGPHDGGNTITITNIAAMGDGSDITNVTVGGAAATIVGQGTDWVTITLGIAADNDTIGDILIQSTTVGDTTLAGAYTYNPKGFIGNEAGWQNVAGLPVVLDTGNVVVYSNRLYSAGGTVAGSSSTNVYRFDGTNWMPIVGIPGPRRAMGCVVYNGLLYAIGGIDASSVQHTNVWTFDGTGWSETVGLPYAVCEMGCAVWNGKIYCIGGGGGGTELSSVCSFDGTSWSMETSLPGARTAIQAQTLNGFLYALGGYDDAPYTNVWQYDGSAWTEVPGYPIACCAMGTAVRDGLIYSMGGMSGPHLTNCWTFDGSTWTEIEGLPRTLYAPAGASYNGQVYCIGGHNSGSGTTNVLTYPSYTGGINPADGPVEGGFQVTINGVNLGNGSDITNVTLCGVEVTSIDSQSDTQAVVTAAAGTPCSGDVCIYSTSYGKTFKNNAFSYYQLIPSAGPYAGGNTITITNGSLGNGTDITNVLVDGTAAVITGQGANWVTITLPAASSAGLVNVRVQSVSQGETLLQNAYTYNPAGKITVPNIMMEYLISFTGTNGTFFDYHMNDLYVTNYTPYAPGGTVYTYVSTTNTHPVELAATNRGELVKNDVWINLDGFVDSYNGGWNDMAGGLWWLSTNAGQWFVFREELGNSYVTITNLPGTNYDVEVINAYGEITLRYNQQLHPGIWQPGDPRDIGAWGTNIWGGWQNPGGGGNWFTPSNTYWWRDRYIVYSNTVPQDRAMTLVLWDTNQQPCNVLNAMRICGEEPLGKPVDPPRGSWTGGYPVVISGVNLGDGSDITNVTLCGFSVSNIVSQSATQITVIAKSIGGAFSGDVVVYSTSYGTTVKSNAFTYLAPEMIVIGTNGTWIAGEDPPDYEKGTEFPSIRPGVALTNAFGITNRGNVTLDITGWTTNGVDADLFQVMDMPLTVDAGTESNFTVAYNPNVPGLHTATVELVSSDVYSPYVLNFGGRCYDITTNNGPYGGGGTVTITNGALGNGSDITNVMVGGVAATITGQGTDWVTITLPPAASAGPKDILIESASLYETLLANAYTYNPMGILPDGLASWIMMTNTWFTGTNGTRFTGPAEMYFCGSAVSSAGDIDNDGYDDMMIGAEFARNRLGQMYTIYGRESRYPAEVMMTNTWLDGTNGFMMMGASSEAYLGGCASSAGDVNGDGLADMLIGAYQYDVGSVFRAGQAFMIYGRSNGFPAYIQGNDSWIGNSTNAVKLGGVYRRGKTANSVSSAGDVNGDGLDDILIGSPQAYPGEGRGWAGETYLVYGTTNLLPNQIRLTNTWLDGVTGIILEGAVTNDQSGCSVSSAGDVNGDGLDDLLIGAQYAAPNGLSSAGEAYLVYGSTNLSATVILTNTWLDGVNGVLFAGAHSDGFAGRCVSSAGDVNGDGLGDLLIGAGGVDVGTLTNAGAVYLVYGSTNLPASVILTNTWFDGANGVMMTGAGAASWLGNAISSAGDVNGDGLPDLLIAASGASPLGRTGAGEAYLVYARKNGLPAHITMTSNWLNGVNGVLLAGATAQDFAGDAVSSAGDVNADGYADMLIGAYQADPNGSASGEAYLIYGLPFPVSPASGAWGGGYPVAIKGLNIGNMDITNVTLCGLTATIISQTVDQVWVAAAAAPAPVLGDVKVYSVSYGETVRSNGFTYTAGELILLGTNGTVLAEGEATSLIKGNAFYPTLFGAAQTNTFSITNSGNDVLAISAYDLSNPTDFSVSPIPANIDAGGVASLIVTYSPTTIGNHSAFVTFTNNTPNSPFTLNLSGSCYAMSTNNGPYVGDNSIAITNGTLGDGMDITNVLIGGVAASITGQGTDWVIITLPVTGSAGIKDILIQSTSVGDTVLRNAYTYNPAGIIATVLPASCFWTGNCPVVVNGTDLCNGGVDDITSVTLAGVTATVDSVNGSTQLLVTAAMSPATSGDAVVNSISHGITISSNAFTYYEPAMTALGTNGSAIASGDAANAANGTEFGSLIVNMGALTNTFSITNNGNTMLNITGVTTSGTGSAAFELVSWPSSVAVGAEETFTVIFTPDSGGSKAAALNFANDGTSTPYVVNLAGFGSGGGIALATNYQAYSATYNGSDPSDQSILMDNVGVSGFTYTNLHSYSPGASDWLTILPGTGTVPNGGFTTLTNSIDITGINAGSYTCDIQIVAADATNSPQSVRATLVVAPASQTISFPHPGGQETTNLLGLAATATSGLTVSFNVDSGPGTITGNTNLSFTASGDVVLTASQAGNSNWNAAASIVHTIVVTKATAPVTLNDLPQVYDGTARSVTASTTPGGLTVDFTYEGNTWAPTNAGSYAITGVVNDIIYQGWQTGTLVVAKADQTITFPAIASQTYTSEVGLAASATSGFAVGFAVGSGPATISGSTNLSFTATGAVSIVAAQAGDANWNAAPPVTNSFMVNKAEQVITFPVIADQETTNVTPISATALSTLGVTFSVVSGPASLTGPTSPTSLTYTNDGTVVIAAHQAGSNYWNAAPSVTNTFNVIKAVGTVMLSDLTQVYDASPLSPTSQTSPTGLMVNLTFDGSTNLPVNVGNYTVIGTMDDPIYQSAATDTFTIVQATQTIVFAQLPDMIITDTWGLSATGGASTNPVTFAVLSGPASIAGGTNLTFTNVGEVLITANQAGDSNYLAAATVTNVFTVSPTTPEISTPTVSNILAQTATLGGTIDSTNGTPVTERGVTWWTDRSTNIYSASESGAFGTGAFSLNVTGIVAGITNFFQAYAVNVSGTTYSTTSDFLARPDAPEVTAPTNIQAISFYANWNAAEGALTYYLDVSETNTFDTFVPGYENLDLGDTGSASVTGLGSVVWYYYRVRAENAQGLSTNSATRTVGLMMDLVIDATPAQHDSPAPLGYGTNQVIVETMVTNSVTTPADESNGVRYACTGWTGTGDVPAAGRTNTVSFLFTTDSTLTWQWKTQYLITQESTGGYVFGLASGWKDAGWIFDLTPRPTNGFVFAHWLTNGSYAGDATIFRVLADAPKEISAIFAPTAWDVNVTGTTSRTDWQVVGPNGFGTFEICNPSDSGMLFMDKFLFANMPDPNMHIRYPDGTSPAGEEYVDVTTEVQTKLQSVGNMDQIMDPDECVTLDPIEFLGKNPAYLDEAFYSKGTPDMYDADTDGDTIPNYWEEQEGLNPNNPVDGGEDQDDDGEPSDKEYIADTNPYDAASYLHISDIGAASGMQQVQWIGGTAVVQYLEWNQAMSGDIWSVISTNYPPTPITNLFDDTYQDVEGYYRIRAVR